MTRKLRPHKGPAGDATLAGLRIAKERGMEAPDPQAAVASSNGAPDDTKAATEATKDEPAPGPSANRSRRAE